MLKQKIILISLLIVFLGFCYSKINEIKFPSSVGFVSDFANVLFEDNKLILEKIILEVEQKTSAEIVVVTVKDLSGTTIEDYAVKLFENWRIGKKNKNNGILFITSINEKKVRIEVGYGLEGIINDGLVGEILDKYVLPNYKKGDYNAGILLGTVVIANLVAKEYNVSLTSLDSAKEQVLRFQENEKLSLGQIIMGTIIVVFLLYIFITNPILFLLFLNIGGRGGGFGRGGFGGGGRFGGFGGGTSGGAGASRSW